LFAGVQETFGRWKNRFRFLMYAPLIGHAFFTQLVYVSMILHNLCLIRKDDLVVFSEGSAKEWTAFFELYGKKSCPSCTAKQIIDCPHFKPHVDKEPLRDATSSAELRERLVAMLWEEQDEKARVVLEGDLLDRVASRRV